MLLVSGQFQIAIENVDPAQFQSCQSEERVTCLDLTLVTLLTKAYVFPRDFKQFYWQISEDRENLRKK